MTAMRVDGVRLERAADELLAIRPETSEAHALNQSAAAVYELCDGAHSKADMAAEIRRRSGLPADESIVGLSLTELVDTGLVVLDTPQAPRVISRRSVIRALAISGAAVAMLPIVE